MSMYEETRHTSRNEDFRCLQPRAIEISLTRFVAKFSCLRLVLITSSRSVYFLFISFINLPDFCSLAKTGGAVAISHNKMVDRRPFLPHEPDFSNSVAGLSYTSGKKCSAWTIPDPATDFSMPLFRRPAECTFIVRMTAAFIFCHSRCHGKECCGSILDIPSISRPTPPVLLLFCFRWVLFYPHYNQSLSFVLLRRSAHS